jgi:hypothetical protein
MATARSSRLPAWAWRTLMAMLLAAGALVSVYGHIPPKPRDAKAPATVFSAERAMAHVRAIAQEPHPAGTPAAEKVLQYIAGQIGDMGQEPVVRELVSHRGPGEMSTVRNVMARLRGTAGPESGAAVFVAHYDSVSFGPGAADNGAGVAALLEAMRALLAGPPLRNDLIFLFTDGEEGRIEGHAGLRGAWAFVNGDPWARDVRVAVNFDARGVRGPSYLYETSLPNQWLIRQFNLSGARRPVASSVMAEVYRSMPVHSDLTMFFEKGVPGVNFAFVNGLARYHTALDIPGNLMVRSLEHHGENALGMARRLGNEPLERAKEGGTSVYFNLPLVRMVQYSTAWLPMMCAIGLGLLFLGIVAGLLRGRLQIGGILAGLWLWFAATVACAAFGGLVFWVAYRARDFYFVYNAGPWTLAVVLVTAAVFCRFMGHAWRRTGLLNLWVGSLLWWAAGLAATTAWLPGASYAFFGPLVTLSVGLLWLTARPVPAETHGRRDMLLMALLALPAMYTLAGLMMGLYAAVLLLGAPGQTLLLMLMLGAILPHLAWVFGGHLRTASKVLGLAALVAVIWGVTWTPFTGERPKLTSLAYAMDADYHRAWWISADSSPDVWNRPFLTEMPEVGPLSDLLPATARGDYLRASAPVLPLDAPSVELVSDSTADDTRSVRLRIDSPRGAPIIEMHADPGLEVRRARANGRDLLPVAGRWYLDYSIYRGGGIDLELDVPAGSPVRLQVTDRSYGLPEALGVPGRPANRIPQPNTVDYNRNPLKTDEVSVTRRVAY